jgi:hypothetical protein
MDSILLQPDYFIVKTSWMPVPPPIFTLPLIAGTVGQFVYLDFSSIQVLSF